MGKLPSRIEQIANNEGITLYKLEQSIGASKGVLTRAVANNTDIQSKWLTAILDKYPQYNADWLITGNGEMLKTESLVKEPDSDYKKEGNTEAELLKKLLFGNNFEEILNNQDAATDALARLIVNQNKLLDDVADIKSMLAKKKANNN